jgi:hypothetical protein
MARVKLRVRLLALVATVVVALAALELTAYLVFRLVEGERFTYGALAIQRREVDAGWERLSREPPPAAATPLPVDPDGVEGRPDRTPAETVPHPFLGYVANPESPAIQGALGKGGMLVSEHGFLVLPKAGAGTGEEWTVAVFGGSVAAFLSVDGRRTLAEAVASSPLGRGRRVRVRSFAQAGYKQPQMALTLAYLLSLGERFDAVVELDGVNDLALSYIEHRWRGKFPFYPREWEYLVSDVGDPQHHLRIGAIAYQHSRRASVARFFSRKPLRWSVAACLVWRRLDRAYAARLAAAREAAVAHRNSALTYRERGPLRNFGDDAALLRALAKVWARSSAQMNSLCVGSGIRYHHFLQPNQYVAGSKPMGAAERRVALAADQTMRWPIEHGYPLLQEEGRALAQEGVAFSDLSSVFAQVQEPIYVDNCCHLSPHGSEILAHEIGSRLATTPAP